MTILLDLIPYIKRVDRKLTTSRRKLNSWIFYNIRGGHKCTMCGAKHLKFAYGEGEGVVPHNDGHTTRMLLSWHLFGRGVICPICAHKAVIEVFETYRKTEKKSDSREHVHIGDCDFTGQKGVPVIGIIWGESNTMNADIRFGKEWWNGFSASQHAFEMAFTSLTMRSSVSTYIDGEVYYEVGKYITKYKQTYREFFKKNFT